MASLANVLHQALHMQWKQLDLFPALDYHNNNVIANLHEFMHDRDSQDLTDYQYLEVIADIVSKRRKPAFDTVDCTTRTHYLD